MNNSPLLQTKFYIPPPRANSITRARLSQQLDAALELAQQLIVIAAPAGFGKTTVVSEWIQKRLEIRDSDKRSSLQSPVFAFLTLDDADNDPTRFWTYFIAALQTTAPHAGENARALLRGDAAPDSETLVTLLVNDLVSEAQTRVLVLDDYHAITNDAIHRALIFLLDHLPQNFFLVLTTRFDPPFPLSRLRARGKLLELRADDLRFTADEAAEFLQRALGIALTAAQVNALEERTEGWIAGLQLAALAISSNRTQHGQGDVEKFIRAFTGSHRYVMDYLVDEALARQDDATQNFLLQTSILERFNAELCDLIIERNENVLLPPSSFLLQELERANLFLVALDDAREWFRYHHLFAELLRHRLAKTRAAWIPELHRRASEWFEQKQLLPEAIEHAFAAQAPERVAELLNAHLAVFTARGEQATIRQWLTRLPSEIIARNPLLALALAHGLILEHRLDNAEPFVNQAEDALAQFPNAVWRDRARGEIARSRVYLAVFRQDFTEVLDIAPRALETLPLAPSTRAEILQGMGLAYSAQGEAAQAARVYTQAIQVCHAGGEIYEPLTLYANLAETYLYVGHLSQGLKQLEQARAHAAEHRLSELPIMANVHQTLTEVHYKRNELAAAEAHQARARVMSERMKLSRMLYYSLVMQARLAHAHSDFARAQELLNEAQRLVAQFDFPKHMTKIAAITQVWVWLGQGNLTAARAWVNASAFRADRAIASADVLFYRAYARVLLADGETETALNVLAHLAALKEKQLSFESRIDVQILYALAHAAQRTPRAALNALENALALAEPERFIGVFLQTGAALYALLVELRAKLEIRALGGDKTAQRLFTFAEKILAASPIARTPNHSSAPSLQSPPHEPLTQRETQVLLLLAHAKSNQEIADELFLSLSAIKKYTGTLFAKLGVHNRTEAVVRARERNLIS